MILVGQYDSSYVRRVAIALRIYGLAFEHRPWSVFSDGDKVQAVNPLMRVPVLVLAEGDAILDSHSMLDYIDRLVPPEERLLPQHEPERHVAMRVMSLATGLADKGAALFYELRHHIKPSPDYVARIRGQMLAAATALDRDRAARKSTYWFGERIGHADIAVACAFRHMDEAHPGLFSRQDLPALVPFCARMETLPVMREFAQAFDVPA